MSRLTDTGLLVALTIGVASGCLPYTVGGTAATTPEGEWAPSGNMYFIPNAIETPGDSVSGPLIGGDVEARFGLSPRSDVGIRIPSYSGIVVSYKRRLGTEADDRPGVAAMGAAGIVNLASHAYVEGTLIASARESDRFTPYIGVRIMHVVPIARGAVDDSPTAGGFFGARVGTRNRGISPEIGIYYDRSALGLRKSTVIFVPAVTLHGADLLDLLR